MASSHPDRPCVNAAEKIELEPAVDERPATLPLELIVLVSEFLAGDDHYETLAALSSTCGMVRAETVPVLYETVIFFPDSILLQLRDRSEVLRSLERQRKHIRYLINGREFAHLLTFDLPNICVKISRNRDSSEHPHHASSMDGHITITVGGIVSATTLEHLINLCFSAKRAESVVEPLSEPSRTRIRGFEVLETGRIVGVDNYSSPPWYFHHQQYLDFIVGGSTKGSQETMRYLYGGFSHDHPDVPVVPCSGFRRPWIKMSIKGDISAFDVFINTVESLLHRCSSVAPTITLQASRVTVEEVKTRMPALAALYARNWPRMAASLQHQRDNDFLHVNIENDGNFIDMPSIGEWLHFGVEDATTRGRSGVTFVLVDHWVRYLWEETYSSLQMPAETAA